MDDLVDQGAFDDGLGLAIPVELFGEYGAGGGIFAGEDARFGVDSVFESIHAGDGLTLGGARSSGELRVAAVSFDLTN